MVTSDPDGNERASLRAQFADTIGSRSPRTTSVGCRIRLKLIPTSLRLASWSVRSILRARREKFRQIRDETEARKLATPGAPREARGLHHL